MPLGANLPPDPIRVIQDNYVPPEPVQGVAVLNTANTTDIFARGQSLPHQDAPAGGGVLTFVFSIQVQTVGVYIISDTPTMGYLDPFGGFPSPTTAIPVDSGVQVLQPIQAQSIRIWVPEGCRVAAWAFAYNV